MNNRKAYIVAITNYRFYYRLSKNFAEVVKMNLTTIQVREETRKKLEMKKAHPRESYDSVIQSILESESTPSMEEMFRIGDSLKQKRHYTTEEIIKLSHELREKR